MQRSNEREGMGCVRVHACACACVRVCVCTCALSLSLSLIDVPSHDLPSTVDGHHIQIPRDVTDLSEFKFQQAGRLVTCRVMFDAKNCGAVP